MAQKIRRLDTNLGFTLIELLVVVSIIALLVSILLPALAKARQQTYRVQCLTNVKQIGMAITMYSHEWNDYYPPQTWAYAPADRNYWSMWRKPLLPYLNNDDAIFYCPVGKKRWGVNSYRMRPKTGKSVHYWKLTDFGSPATFMILQDTSPQHGTPEQPKHHHPQLFADIHAELGVWIDLFSEGW